MNLAQEASRWAGSGRRAASSRAESIGPGDVLAVVAVNALLVGAMWIRHGGLDQLSTPAGVVTAAGQLTALYGTFAALLELVLLSRSPWLDRTVGTDRLVGWHRWVGFACLWLISAHLILTTVGWAAIAGRGLLEELGTLLFDEAYVFMATVGFVLFVAVAASSMRWVRRRLSYETWYGIHLYAYIGIALAFLHALFVGSDFIDDPVAVAYWLVLYALAFGLVLVFRVGAPIALNLRHRLVVAEVVPEAAGAISVYITGRGLDRLQARAGQFFQWRFLTGGGWWRPHPYSLSAAPDGRSLRITIKDLGDDTALAQRLRPGVRVLAEGPYGAFTADLLTRPKAVFVAGGIGITPLRAMLEELPPSLSDVLLVYRATSWPDVAFRRELDARAADKRVRMVYLVGRRADAWEHGDPLAPEAMSRLVPDIAERDVFVSGSEGFVHHVRRSLRTIGLQGDQVHAECFAF